MAGYHGFDGFITYIKATLSIGGPIVLSVWGVLVFALDDRYDDRYAPATLQEAVKVNSRLAAEVAGKVDDLAQQLTLMQVRDLRREIQSVKLRTCEATTTESRQYHAQTLSDLVQEYQSLTGTAPRIPSCDELE